MATKYVKGRIYPLDLAALPSDPGNCVNPPHFEVSFPVHTLVRRYTAEKDWRP